MDFNIAPFYDDFDETKQFYKILFRPGVAVQTREVNQLQTILQDQITKFGNHVFKEGSMVIPGQVNYNDKLKYLKVASVSLGTGSLSDLEDQLISNTADGTGVVAQVIKAIPATDADSITLVLLYSQSNQVSDGSVSLTEFLPNTTLYVLSDTTKTITVGAGVVSGRSVAAGLQAGVYFLAGHFVSVPSAVLSVKKYADTVTDINVRIGIQYTEQIITADTDDSLYDNALGSPNYAAPGAQRYKISTELVQVGLSESPTNFFELLRVEEGVLQSIVNSSQYNILEETLARRTYDESGNYVVDDFKFDIREARNSNRGNWAPGVRYEVSDIVKGSTGRYFECLVAGSSSGTEPANFTNTAVDESTVTTDGSVSWRYTTNPISNRGLSQDGSTSNLVATFGIGKAYVQGYEINKTVNSNITIPKARDTVSTNNQSIPLTLGNYMYADKRYTVGIPDVSTIPQVLLYDRFYYKGSGNKFGLGNIVGSARLGWTEPDSRGFIKVGLSNIQMSPGKSFSRDVNSVIVPDTTTSYAVTSYTLTSNIKYTGSSAAYLAFSGTIGTSAQATTLMTVSGTGTAFLQELNVGDLITLGSSSWATTSSWTVVAISSNTVLTVTGGPLQGNATTAGLVRLPGFTVFGHQTSTGTRFQSEYRVGDTIWLTAATNSSIITSIASESRMTVSSNVGILIAQTSHGTYYVGRSALFAADVGENYAIGINAKKLTGNFTLTDYTGAATTVGSHIAVRITGSNDAKLLTEVTTNDFVDVNGNKLLITKVSSNTIAYGICLENTITGSTSATYPGFKVNNTLVDTNNTSLLFPVAPSAVQSIVDNVMTVYKTTAVTVSAGVSSVVVSLSAASGNDAAEAAATTDPGAYFVAQNSVGTLSGPITVNSVTVGANTISLVVNSTFSATTVRVTYPVVRAASAGNVLGRLKTKTLTLGAYDDFLGTSAAIKATLQLTKADVYRKVKIYMATSFTTSWDTTVQTNATDVTKRYELDTGQRPNFYDLGSVKLISGYPAPTGSIRVYYDYFDHSAGDFFARSSYDPLPYENIPYYNNVRLADVLDFRARVTDTATGLVSNAATPRFGTGFVGDVSYYLGRRDKVYLDRSGVFYSIQGVSDLKPQLPKKSVSENAIELYDIELKPYTISAGIPEVRQTKYDNRRYTMKDIGSIEKRVTNLEETTALSLLETKTSALQIRDNRDSTLERYKTGFFVDNFADDSNAERDGDARFSIDFVNRTLNTQVEYNRLALVEKLNTNATTSTTTSGFAVTVDAVRAAQNYMLTGDLLTLNYTTSTLLSQDLATTSIAVAPFITATFLGSMRVVPDKDVYEDVHYTTNITQTINNLTPAALAALVAQYRAHDRRPYRVDSVTVNTYIDTTKTSFLIPFCRANTILWIAKGLKPNSKFYPFFDDLPVEDYMTGAMKFTFSALPNIDFEGISPLGKKETPRWRSLYESRDVQEVVRARYIKIKRRRYAWVYDYGWFHKTLNPVNFDRNVPSAANRDAYRTALGIGTSVWYYEGGKCVGSGVGVYQEGASLYIVNGRGKLAANFLRSAGSYSYTGTWYISVEGNDPKYLPTTTVTAAQCLTSDANGYVYSNGSGVAIGLFDLPDTDTVKFTTGKKPVVFTDDINNDPDNWTSRAEGSYYVEGYDVTFTKNYISTKNYVLRPYDPIAQSFKIPSQFDNGCFITDIDIYFQAKPVSEPATVSLELRSCDSTGRPSGTEMVPGSEVTLRPEQVTIDATKGQIPTKFTFRQPIYLMPEKQYAFVLRTDTKNYRVWMATMGQTDVNNPSSSYTTQALFGSLFKSQDGTLWTEDQTSDLKFRINRAVFDTRDTGAQVYVVNTNTNNEQLPSNPFTFVHGSNKIRVGQKDHGFSSGDSVRFYSQYWAGQYASLGQTANINGIPVGEIFGAYVSSDVTTFQPNNADVNQPRLKISDVTLDTYTVTVSSVANIAGGTTGYTSVIGGGDDIFGQRNVPYQVIKPNASILKSAPTDLTFTARVAKGFTYDTDANSTPAQYGVFTKDLNINDYNILDTSCVILTDTVEYDRITTTSVTMGAYSETWQDSFIGVFKLRSSSNHVSPAIDVSTLHIDTMTHRIDNPSYGNRLPPILPAVPAIGSSLMILMSTIVSSNTTIAFDGAQRRISTITDNLFADVVPGRYITVSGSTVSGNTYTSTGLLVLNVTPDGRNIFVSGTLTTALPGDSITIRQIDDFTEEATLINASGESKYITNIINLANPASQLKLQMETCCPSAADFDVYYKTGTSGQTDMDSLVWTKYVVAGTTSSYTNLVKSDTRGNFTDVEFNISGYDSTGVPQDLNPFTSFQIKIVMRSTNAARVPQFRNMRVIAHA